jgi:phosphatidylglycerol:prolipoprotein diacylglycerol transferase
MPNALPVIPFPTIDPVALAIGPFDIRWYAIAYIIGLILGWRYVLRLARQPGAPMTAKEVDDFIVWATIGVVLGGRIGYVLFYRPGFYFANPEHFLYVWQGGMAFHGGLLGVMAAIVLFSRKRGLRPLEVSDIIAAAAPIGLFFGRIANFINAELFGRPSDVAWAVIFPTGGPEARHPSQLYEAALEGVLLFAVIAVLLSATRARERPGLITGVFFGGYGIARIVVEFFREPDAHLGFLLAGVTMGQILSLPVLGAGAYLIARAMTQPPRPAETTA